MKRAGLTVALGIGLWIIPSAARSLDLPEFPAPPVARDLSDRVSSTKITGTPFDKYLKYKTYRVEMKSGDAFEGGFVYGPGHHCSGLAALVLDPSGVPYVVFKRGDTRLSRAMRDQPYVATSAIAGRWDKEGHSAGEIVLDELSEEVGGEVVEGTFRRLGDKLSPTMAFESTECDEYFTGVVRIVKDPYGDGGQMEAVGLIGPEFQDPEEAVRDMDNRLIFDAGRARTMLGRAWDSIGYIPTLGFYVQDQPRLLKRYDSLGLGPPRDPRGQGGEAAVPGVPVMPYRSSDSPASRIRTAFVVKALNVPLGPGSTMIDARIKHAYGPHYLFYADQTLQNDYLAALSGEWSSRPDTEMQTIDPDFASQFLRLDYDRAKIAVFYVDQAGGPLVEMVPQARPALAFAPGSPSVVRLDIRDVTVSKSIRDGIPKISNIVLNHGKTVLTSETEHVLPHTQLGELKVLAAPNAASSGQSDLFYHYVSCRLDGPPTEGRENFFPLAEAIRLCREGHGDAQTEATLLRLADDLGWIPELGMSREDALKLKAP